jgi:hypothetical protein
MRRAWAPCHRCSPHPHTQAQAQGDYRLVFNRGYLHYKCAEWRPALGDFVAALHILRDGVERELRTLLPPIRECARATDTGGGAGAPTHQPPPPPSHSVPLRCNLQPPFPPPGRPPCRHCRLLLVPAIPAVAVVVGCRLLGVPL